MATPRKRGERVKTVVDENYSKLDQYAISLHEFYKSLRAAGFTNDNSLWILSSKEAHPDWLNGVSIKDIKEHLEEEDD